MTEDIVTYQVDGRVMQSRFIVDPDAGAVRPGILVFPEAFGLGEHAIDIARRLAGLGYAALACDLHGDAAEYDDITTVMTLLGELQADMGRVRSRAMAGFDALTARPEVDAGRIAAIGYCFGGTMALELARSGAPLCGTVGFHSGLLTCDPTEAGRIAGKVLACIGADDPTVGRDHREAFEAEMTAAGVDWQLHVYGGVVHSFTSPAADTRGAPQFARYDARADRRSWAAMLALFEEIFAE